MELTPTFKNINFLHLSCHTGSKEPTGWLQGLLWKRKHLMPPFCVSYPLYFWTHVAYLVNLSIYWRLWSLSGECCRINKDLQKRPLLIVWREDTMQKYTYFLQSRGNIFLKYLSTSIEYLSSLNMCWNVLIAIKYACSERL